MADEKVTIKIEVRSDDGAIDKTRRKLERLSGAEGRHYKKNSALASKGSSDIKNYGKNTSDVLNNGSRKWKKHFDSLDKGMKAFGSGLLKLVAMSAKMAAIEIGAMGLAMVAVHGAFLLGKGLAKMYQVAMQGAAAGIAGLAIAAGTAAAAMRENQAAMFAFSQTGHKELGNGLNQTRAAMRMLTHDADMAAVGVDNLNAAYGEIVNKSGKFNAGSAKMLKGLMDFASAGQDLKTGTKAAATLVAELQNVKGTYDSIKSAAKGLGPQMTKALEAYEKAGGAKKGKAGLVEAITSGKLAELGGVVGQFDAVNSTLINQAKALFTNIKNEFGDFGQQFLEPVKYEFKQVGAIIKATLQRLSGEFGTFANSGFLENISVVVEKIANGTVNIIRKYLPAAQGMFKRFGDWWDKFTSGWKRMVEYLRPLQDGARVIEDMLKNVMIPIWDELKGKFGAFNRNLQKYRQDFENFGTAVGNLVVKVMQYGSEVQQIFFESLPFINKVIDGVTTLIEHFTSFLGGFKKVTGVVEKFLGGKGFGNFMLLAGLITYGKKMKGAAGGFVSGTSMSGIREAANMKITAGVVNINGKPVASYGRPGVAGHTTATTATGGTVTRGMTPTSGGGPYPGVTPGRPGAPGFASGGVPAAMTSVAGAANMASTALTTLAGVASGGSRASAGGALRGPNGGHLIRSGKYKGQEILQQRVGNQNPRYIYGGPGTGPVDQAQLRASGKEFRSGVFVPKEYRVDEKGRKRFTAHGRIINRRERFFRGIGEGQKLGATGYVGDGAVKTRFDRAFARANNGLGGRLGRGADWMRDRQIARSQYLGPDGTPGPRPGKGPWKLSSNKLNGPGTSIFGKRADKFYNGSFYNNWLSPTSNIGQHGPIEPRTGVGRAISNIKTGTRGIRASRLGTAVLGNSKTGQKGFNSGSMAGAMGTAVGMQLLSSKMDESAQGSMALGSSIAMMNPLAGMAVGFGGAAMNARTGKGGAVMGAAAGAAIGTMIAPGIGTAVGTVVGAIAGGIKGVFNRVKKEKEDSRAVMEGAFKTLLRDNFKVAGVAIANQQGVGESAIAKVMPQYLAQIGAIGDKARATQSGGMSPIDFVKDMYANQRSYGITMDEKQYGDMLKQPQSAIDYALKTEQNQGVVGTALTADYKKRLTELQKITGMSEMEIENLARTLDVNLMDSTVSWTQTLKDLGQTMVKTGAEMRGMQTDVFVSGLTKFDDAIKTMEAPKILNEKAAAFRDLLDAGAAGDSDIASFFRDIAVDSQALAGGGLRGALKLKEVYGVGGTAYAQQADGAKGYLYGKEQQVLGSTGGQTMLNYTDDAILKTSKNLAGFVNNQLLTGTGEGENRYAVNADLFGGALSRLDPNIAGKIEGALLSGDLFAGVDMTNIAQVEERLKAYDPSLTAGAIGLQSIASDKDMASSLGEIANMPDDLKAVFDGFISEYKAFFTSEATTPEWFTKEAFKELIESMDTSSPRGKGIGDTTSSRLSQTLGRHSMMDSALVGKRTITSAYRTAGLGSPSSDHIMGRAYDLTGQNLGGYSKMVHANGGFAEFHGVNSNRHLHVVPGPGIGDTMVPKRMSSGSQGGATANTTNSYVINVEGGTGASAEAIATLTMRKIKLMQDNERQRS
jgi:hypothetical protein